MTTADPEQMRTLADEKTRTSDWHTLTNAVLRAAAGEVERQRALIANAPHALSCDAQCYDSLGNVWDSTLPCTCWNAAS